MNRRLFSKLLALSSGSFGFWQDTVTGDIVPVAAGASDDAALAQAGNAVPAVSAKPSSEPVNVADFQALAQNALPRATYEYITTGSTDEVTLRDNVAAFQRIRILPPLLTGVSQADPSTTVLKQPISFPVLLAPVAGQILFHKQGALAAARVAAAVNTIYGVSSSVGHSVEEVAAASAGPKWFQLYVPKDRAVAKRTVERVERAGYKALIVTVDLGERKDSDLRNRFTFPPDVLRKHLRDNGFDLSDRLTYEELLAFNAQAWDLGFSWDFFDWLRSITKLPLLIKGVLRAEDAKRAVALGLDGIIVSNHGGRRLDGMPASIDQLAHVVKAVDGRTEVFLDSGVRRGTDVLKAIALGARAVLIGRPYAWALAADGEAGVRRILELLREEFITAMLATGCPTVREINRSLLQL